MTNLEQQLNDEFTKFQSSFRIGRFIVQPIYWAEDENENVYYDINGIVYDFQHQLEELKELNKTSNFSFVEDLYE